MVRQLIRSAIRDCAVCTIGALWPSSRPATTTATTPEAWISSAAMKAANGTTNEIAGVEHRVGDPLAHLARRPRRRRSRRQRRRPRRPGSRRPTCEGLDADRRRGDRRAQRHQGGGVVEQRLALEDRHDPARQPDPAGDRGRGHGVRRRDHGADRERDRPGDAREQRVHDAPTPRVVNTTRPTDSSRIGPPVRVEVDERGPDRRGVEQRRQQPQQHHLGLEVDLGDTRHVRRRDAGRDEQQRRREAQAARPAP